MNLRIVTAASICATCICVSGQSVAQDRREVPEFRRYGPQLDQAHADSIDRFIMTFKSAWADQDIDELLSLHAVDTEWTNAYARIFQDRAPLMEFLRTDLFPAFAPDVSQAEIANLRPISIRHLGDAAAVLHLYTDGTRGVSRNQQEDLRRSHIHLVIELQDENWRIVHTAIMDAR